jgi:predicted acetyltransferase
MPLVLRKLRPNDEDAFLRAFAFTSTSDPNFAHYYRTDLTFEEYLGILHEAEQGRGLPDGQRARHLAVRLRGWVGRRQADAPALANDFLLRIGGHIGYVVVPEHRRRGYATEMLRQGLDLARSMGMEKVLVTCDEDNVASRRIIEKCGGKYEDLYSGPEAPAGKRRYWIALS